MKCPCCGNELVRPDLKVVGQFLPGGGQERRMVLFLAERHGRLVPTDWLIDHLWSGAKIPERPEKIIGVMAHHLRRKLAPFGITISGVPGCGGYRMAWLSEESVPA